MGEHRLAPDNRIIMLSGASRGIGAAIARRLHTDGYRLSLGVREPDAGWRAVGPADRARVAVFPFDSTKAEMAAAWVDATMATFGRIDGLINNAGVLRQVGFDAKDDDALDEMWEVNAKAPFRLIRLTLPHLRISGRGRVINIGSTDGKRYRDLSVSVGYAMTKHAVTALSHAARFAGWDDGVRVTALMPGAVDTDLIAGIPGVTPGPGRIDPDVIADAVSFLLGLPNNAAMAEFIVNTRLEPTL